MSGLRNYSSLESLGGIEEFGFYFKLRNQSVLSADSRKAFVFKSNSSQVFGGGSNFNALHVSNSVTIKEIHAGQDSAKVHNLHLMLVPVMCRITVQS